MYLLDTDTIIYCFKGHPAIEKNLRLHLYDPIKISIITLMELYYGAYKSEKMESNLAKIKMFENSVEIIPLGKESVDVFAIYKANLEKSGNRFKVDPMSRPIFIKFKLPKYSCDFHLT